MASPASADRLTNSLDFSSATRIFSGDEEEAIQLVGIEGIVIHATDLKIKNVVFYLFANANFTMNAKTFSEVKNVRIVRLKLEGSSLFEEEVANWPDINALRSFMRQHRQRSRSKSF